MPGKGRPFMPGCKPGPGRPKRTERLKDYANAVKAAVPPKVLGRIVRRLAKRALTGTGTEALRSAELVIRVTLGGDPAAVIDILDRLDELDEQVQQEQQGQQERQRD